MDLRSALLMTAFALGATPLAAQVTYDFTDGDLSFWGIEGDGSLALETTNGNPGNSMRVNEPANGPINYVIAHPARVQRLGAGRRRISG
jgi:hypothetical protein